jgi:hypothetical protein
MKAKSMLTKSLGCLLLLMTTASFVPTALAANSEANDADPNDAITATASLLRDSYTIGQPVPIEIEVTNRGQEPAYIKVDEFGFLPKSVTVEDINGSRIYPLGVPSPPAPPRHWWITADGKKIYTEPVVKIESGQKTKLAIQDALDLYHDQLQPGIYYLIPSDLTVIHEVGSIITREDQAHPLWIDPNTVISKARYEINKVEITLHKEKIIYVDDDAVGLNDGSSWQNAYTFLQDALTTARLLEAEKPLEIQVAQGIYRPNQGLIEVVPGGIGRGGQPYPPKYPVDLGSWASFALINGVTIRGGYAGVNEPDPNVRDIKLYESILSGDLNGDDIEADDPCDLFDEPTRSDNSSNVVKGSNTDETAVLDGVTITGGNIWAYTFGFGGPPIGGAGMLISSGSPTIIDCNFTRNVTGNYGGGLLTYGNGNPTLINCAFTENYADWGAGMYNGAYSRAEGDFSNPKFINCTFDNNYAGWIGGGIYDEGGNSSLFNCTFSRNFGSGFIGGDSPEFIDCIFIQNNGGEGGGVSCKNNPTFTNCTFNNNSAKYYGGGMNCSNGLLTDCIFSGNSAYWGGGGLSVSDSILNNCIFVGNRAYGDSLYNDGGGGCYLSYDEDGDNTTIVTNCTFYGNWASLGNAISQYRTSFLRLTNCILWDGGDEISRSHPSTLTVTYSNKQGGWQGEGNIDEYPLFANPGYWANADDPNIAADPNDPNTVWIDGDYHLKSQAGRWDPVSESWIVDDTTSPCIDAGDPNTPVGDELEPNGGTINMGAYGGTPEASKSFTVNDSRY